MYIFYSLAVSAVGALLWHALQLDPETAQLKDLLALLHNKEVQCNGLIAAGLMIFFHVENGWFLSTPPHYNYGPMPKGDLCMKQPVKDLQAVTVKPVEQEK